MLTVEIESQKEKVKEGQKPNKKIIQRLKSKYQILRDLKIKLSLRKT